MKKEITIRVKISPPLARAAVILALLCWAPGQLGSESIILATTYPSPTGIYGRIITTGTAGPTLLSTQQNNVGIGAFTQASPPMAKLTVRQTGGGFNDGIVFEHSPTGNQMSLRSNGNYLLIGTPAGGVAGFHDNNGVSIGAGYVGFQIPPANGLIVQGAAGIGTTPAGGAAAGTLVVSGLIGDAANPGCWWQDYTEGLTTLCRTPGSGATATVINWRHSGPPGFLVNCPTPGTCNFDLPRSGSMLCCRFRPPQLP